MSREKFKKLNKDDLFDIIMAAQDDDDETPILRALDTKLNNVMAEMAEMKAAMTSPDSFFARKCKELEGKINKQADIISQQQRFLEMLDKKEREDNVVILGLPDEGEALEGAVTDVDKMQRVWEKIGVPRVQCQHRRLGTQGNNNRKRPLLLTIRDKELRSRILSNAKNLKSAGESYSRIYVKKDVHPGVRKEWERLREAEKREKERPENVGYEVKLDTRERKLYRNGEVIDGWNPQFL